MEQSEKVRDIVIYLKDKQFKLDNEIDLKATGGVALTYKPSVCVHKYMRAGYDFNGQFIERVLSSHFIPLSESGTHLPE